MAEKNKNQTAQERARMREVVGAQTSGRYCASDGCPTKADPILKKDLYPIVMAYPRRTMFFHPVLHDRSELSGSDGVKPSEASPACLKGSHD